MKGDRYPENKKARQILCKYGIDPYIGCENLVVSQNWCHSAWYAQQVWAKLKNAKSTRAVKAALNELAGIHRRCDGDKSGEVKDEIDE